MDGSEKKSDLKENQEDLISSADIAFSVMMATLDKIYSKSNIDPIKVIDGKIAFITGSIQREKSKIYEKWRVLKSKCTHPDIGNGGMYICPDCEWSGEPSFPEELSERDYAEYDEKIKEIRQLNKAKKIIYSPEEIRELKNKIKNEIKEIELLFNNQIQIYKKEKNNMLSERVNNCSHSSLKNNYCPDCNVHFIDPESLF